MRGKWIAAAWLLLVVSICGAAAAAAPEFRPAPCAADVGSGGRPLQCGMLIVDETRGSPTSRRIVLPVAILKATKPTGQPPLVLLHGGPGGGSTTFAAANLARNLAGTPQQRAWYGDDQDVIFFDQRGGMQAAPQLDCGKLNLNDAGPDSPGTTDALKACAARFAASGVNLTRYNAHEVALDFQDLRKALKLPIVDILGVSYGTRIGAEIVRDQPAGVRAVILDSLWPPEAKWAENGAKPVADAVRLILQLCREDPTCTVSDKATLEVRMDAFVRDWLTTPVAAKGYRRPFPVDDFAQYLMDAAYSGSDARALPGVFSKLLAGDFAPLAAYDADRSVYAELQHLTHLCKEQFPFESREKTVANAGTDPYAQALARTLTRYFDVCAGVPTGPAYAGDDRPLASSLPILILNAGIDPGCPPALAEAAVKRLSHGQLVIFPYATHGVNRTSPCAARIARAFLNDPSKPVDKSCLASELGGFHFTGS